MNRSISLIEEGHAHRIRGRGRAPLLVLRWVATAACVALVVSACGGNADTDAGIAVVDGGNAANASTTAGDADSDGDAGDDAGSSDADGGDNGDGADSNGASTSSSLPAAGPDEDDDLPGEPYDFVPVEGTTLDVVGVRYDDVLNFRTLPSASAPIVDTVAPQETTPIILSAGEGRLLPNSAWWKVTVGGESAWANQRFLSMLGVTIDVFPSISDRLDSTTGPTIEGLIEDIVDSYETEGDRGYEMVTEIDAVDATQAQVTIDVLGIGDDAISGERVLLTFDFIFEDDEVVAYELTGAQGTAMCSRGITADDLCV